MQLIEQYTNANIDYSIMQFQSLDFYSTFCTYPKHPYVVLRLGHSN